jgi:hypothetical protein
MATRRIALSLGADLCWPIFYEDIMSLLDPRVRVDDEDVTFEVERVTIEPLDRLTPWYHTTREWIKKAILVDGVYALNNPFTLQAMEKHTSYAAMIRLGLPIPETWLLPPHAYEPRADLQVTLERYAKMFDLTEVGAKVGYPAYLKPFDGGAWEGVTRIEGPQQLLDSYDASGTRIMHLQEAVEPFDLFVRVLAVGPQVNVIRYEPAAPIHARYQVDFGFVDDDEVALLTDMAMTINSFFGWEFNSCEALRKERTFHPIDFANANPDAQVTSLHYHIPWLVKAMIRWSLFCAATKRRMDLDLGWDRYFAIADGDGTYRDKLAAYAELGRERFEADRFEEFAATQLADLDEVAWEYFATDAARSAVHAKVATMFPAHEVEEFTDHFWGLIQFWRKTERDRLGTPR